MDNIAVKRFLSFFQPANNLVKANSEVINKYEKILPSEIISLWKKYGFGNYGEGVLKIVDPTLYKKNLDKWLNIASDDNIPFMINAFGDIYYIKRLTETMYEINLLSITYRKYKYCASSISEFFTNYITEPSVIGTDLNARIYLYAEESVGRLDNNSIYTFNPIGSEDVKNIKIEDAITYQNKIYGE